MKRINRFLIAAAGLLLAAQSWALAPNDRVDNFMLLDHQGRAHELYYYSDQQAVVLMTQSSSCKVEQASLTKLAALKAAYAVEDIQFFLLNSSNDSRAAIRAQADELGIDIPVLLDTAQIIGESLQVAATGEVLIVDPKSWKVTYTGALNDGSSMPKQYVDNALKAMLTDQAVAVTQTEAEGCAIDFPNIAANQAHEQISYSDTIAPMLIDNCISCHRQGGIGPWAMTDYSMVQGFSPMIREVVRTKRMPPWHADPEFGHWSNDRSLSNEEVQTLVHWIEAGSPRGEGTDPLAEFVHNWPTWALDGSPDLVIDIPGTEVPATGVVDYRYLNVENPLDRDVWVKASEILPGDRSVLHHTITRFGFLETEGPRAGRIGRRGGGGLGGYVPGAIAHEIHDGAGTLLPASATFEFQMHYTTNGKPAVDESKIGIWLHDEKPERTMDGTVLINFRIKIAPHAKAHVETAERVIEKDALLFAMLPHAHFRGKASTYEAFYPDGTSEVLLNVPNYDFNWQTSYILEEPKYLPAGTRLKNTFVWDNSAQNPANPDPTREVPWGEQSWDEMLFATASFRYLTAEEVSEYRTEGRDEVAGAE